MGLSPFCIHFFLLLEARHLYLQNLAYLHDVCAERLELPGAYPAHLAGMHVRHLAEICVA